MVVTADRRELDVGADVKENADNAQSNGELVPVAEQNIDEENVRLIFYTFHAPFIFFLFHLKKIFQEDYNSGSVTIKRKLRSRLHGIHLIFYHQIVHCNVASLNASQRIII